MSTVADWSLLRVGNWTQFNCPSQHNERVRRSADSYLEELKAEAARVRGASPWKFRIVICNTFNGEATIVGEADKLEAATKRRRGLRQRP